MKSQRKTLKKQQMDRNNQFTDKEFKALVIRMLMELGKRIDGHSENFN